MAPTKVAKRAQVEVSSDSDSSIDSNVASKTAVKMAQAKLAGNVSKKAKVVVSESDSSDEDMAPAPVSVACPKCKHTFVPGAKAPVTPVKKAAPVAESSSDDSSDDEPVKPVAKAAPVKKAAPVAESSSDDSSSDDEPVKPVAKVVAPVKKAAPVADSSSDDSSSDDEPVKPVAKAVKKAAPVAAESSSSEDSSSDDEPAKPVAKVVKKVAVAADSSDDEIVAHTKPAATPVAAAPARTEGASEKPEGCCSVFVGNLSWTTTGDDLKWLFEDCGEIVSARVATDRETGKSRGFGHVDFAATESVELALAKAGADLYGRPVRVDFGGRTQGGFTGGKGNGKGGFGGNSGFGGGFGGKGKGKGGFGGGFGGKGKGKGGPAAANKGSIVDFTGSKMTFDDDDE